MKLTSYLSSGRIVKCGGTRRTDNQDFICGDGDDVLDCEGGDDDDDDEDVLHGDDDDSYAGGDEDDGNGDDGSYFDK